MSAGKKTVGHAVPQLVLFVSSDKWSWWDEWRGERHGQPDIWVPAKYFGGVEYG